MQAWEQESIVPNNSQKAFVVTDDLKGHPVSTACHKDNPHLPSFSLSADSQLQAGLRASGKFKRLL